MIKFACALQAGMSLEKARTIAMTTMVFFQFFQAWNSRSETKSIFQIGLFTNPYLAYGLAASVMAHLAAIYAPPFQWLLSTEPVCRNRVAADRGDVAVRHHRRGD